MRFHLDGGAGADRLDGQGGRDLVDYGENGAAVTVNLNAGTASGGMAEGDILVSIEDIAGTDQADFIIGNSTDNTLTGRDGILPHSPFDLLSMRSRR